MKPMLDESPENARLSAAVVERIATLEEQNAELLNRLAALEARLPAPPAPGDWIWAQKAAHRSG